MNLVHLAITLGAVVTTLGTSVITGLFGTSAKAQAITAAVLSLILGLAAAASRGTLSNLSWHSADKVLFAAGIVYTASQVAFHGIWHPTGGSDFLETLVGPRIAAKLSKEERLAVLIGKAVAGALGEAKAAAVPSVAQIVAASTPPTAQPLPPAATSV